MATEIPSRDGTSLGSGDPDGCGAVANTPPLYRVNRMQMQLDGLDNLMTLFSSAMNAPAEHQSTMLVWEPILYKVSMDLKDLSAEVGALWEQVRHHLPKDEAATDVSEAGHA